MDPVHLISFPVASVSDPFRLYRVGQETKLFNPFELPRCPPEWSSWDPVILTESLDCQIRNEYADFEQLKVMCHDPNYRGELWTSSYDQRTDEDTLLRDYYLSEEEKIRQCRKFAKREGGYEDVFSRDDNVFDHCLWNVITHAVVLLYKGNYFGHIYSWVSPIDPSICLAIGIRGKVDLVFQKDQLFSVATYLLEGVRRFALSQGCSMMIVTEPLSVMRTILNKMGFQRITINEEIIGRSATYPELLLPAGECSNCYMHDLSQPFAEVLFENFGI